VHERKIIRDKVFHISVLGRPGKILTGLVNFVCLVEHIAANKSNQKEQYELSACRFLVWQCFCMLFLLAWSRVPVIDQAEQIVPRNVRLQRSRARRNSFTNKEPTLLVFQLPMGLLKDLHLLMDYEKRAW